MVAAASRSRSWSECPVHAGRLPGARQTRPGTSSTPAQFVAAPIDDEFQFRPGGVDRQVDRSGAAVRPDQRPPHIRRQPGDPERRAGSGHGCVLRPGGTIVVTMVNRWAIDGYWLYERLQVRRASRGFTAVRAHCEFVTPGQVRRDLVRLGAGSVAIHGRLLLPLRWVYKVSRSLGRVVARILNPVDDLLCRIPGTAGLTGHLVVVVRP